MPLSVKEFAVKAGYSESNVRKLISAQKIAITQSGPRSKITIEDAEVERFLTASGKEAPPVSENGKPAGTDGVPGSTTVNPAPEKPETPEVEKPEKPESEKGTESPNAPAPKPEAKPATGQSEPWALGRAIRNLFK